MSDPFKTVPVFLTRSELARATGLPVHVVYRAVRAGTVNADAISSHCSPLFSLENLPALKRALEKMNCETIA